MPQFDVHRTAHGVLVVNCQSDTLDYLSSRISVPLLPKTDVPHGTVRLHPAFRIDSVDYVLATHLATAIPVRELGPAIATLAEERYIILGALDVLLTGV
jgi:toxin CcdB